MKKKQCPGSGANNRDKKALRGLNKSRCGIIFHAPRVTLQDIISEVYGEPLTREGAICNKMQAWTNIICKGLRCLLLIRELQTLPSQPLGLEPSGSRRQERWTN